MATGFQWYGSAAAAPYASRIAAASASSGVPADFLTNQLGQESGFNPNAQSPTSSAYGLGQFITSTAANVPGYGPLNSSDPLASIDATAAYDANLYATKGSYTGVLASYGTTAAGDGANSQVLALAQSYDASGSGLGSSNTDPFAGATVQNAAYTQSIGTDTGGMMTGTPDPTSTPAQTAAAAANVQQAQILPNLSGMIGEYFVRGAVLILGLIFVCVGLTMFKNPVSDAVKSVASKIPVPVPV